MVSIYKEKYISRALIFAVIVVLLLPSLAFAGEDDGDFGKIIKNIPVIIGVLIYLFMRKKKAGLKIETDKKDNADPGPLNRSSQDFTASHSQKYKRAYKPIEPK